MSNPLLQITRAQLKEIIGNDPSALRAFEELFKQQTELSVSNFARTLLDDANAAAAATTLGLGTTNDVTFKTIQWGLSVSATGDWNNYKTGGFYRGNALTNAPTAAWYYVIVQAHSATYVTQIALGLTGVGTNAMYHRICHNGTWYAWRKICVEDLTTGDLKVTGNLYLNSAKVATSVAPVTNSVRVTGEYMFTEDHELDYSASFTSGMAAATITFTQLPTNTIAVIASVRLFDTGTLPAFTWKRSSGGTKTWTIKAAFADRGTNSIEGIYTVPTGGNSLYVTVCQADAAREFVIIGYKVGE